MPGVEFSKIWILVWTYVRFLVIHIAQIGVLSYNLDQYFREVQLGVIANTHA